jgi:hypothetical protein
VHYRTRSGSDCTQEMAALVSCSRYRSWFCNARSLATHSFHSFYRKVVLTSLTYELFK